MPVRLRRIPSVKIQRSSLARTVASRWPSTSTGSTPQFGDPAYDLAIVTRGVRRAFQVERGLERVLEAYAAASGTEVTRAHVHRHELAMVACWYKDAQGGQSPHAPPHYLRPLRSVLGRARISGICSLARRVASAGSRASA
jgi:hypothetical protein